MKPIQTQERSVVNIRDEAAFTPYPGETGTSFIQLNPQVKRDIGFYIYWVGPGSHSTPHRHGGAEEFLVVDGELSDNDGTAYRTGDVVWLAPGTEHTSYTEKGCIVVVYSEAEDSTPFARTDNHGN
ncbi:cupin domain-containing protein [Roseovarius nitratireducens]|uniref:cupin domain-containing protein n=1 Tax=Roseovarius nitratireducens TaxID=2044597 RepID=UPI000CE27AE8|nr:cupin domain-containing protein [Roseovarius nitratireducens]